MDTWSPRRDSALHDPYPNAGKRRDGAAMAPNDLVGVSPSPLVSIAAKRPFQPP